MCVCFKAYSYTSVRSACDIYPSLLSVLRWGRPTMKFTSPWSRPPLRTMCPFSGPPCLSWRPITTTLLPITLSPPLCWTTSVSQAPNHSSWPSPIGWQPTGTFKRLPLCLIHRNGFPFLGRVKDSGISALMDFYSEVFFFKDVNREAEERQRWFSISGCVWQCSDRLCQNKWDYVTFLLLFKQSLPRPLFLSSVFLSPWQTVLAI